MVALSVYGHSRPVAQDRAKDSAFSGAGAFIWCVRSDGSPSRGGAVALTIPTKLIEGHEKQVSRVARRRQEYLDSDR